MKGGILEVLLVSAEGIRNTNLIGTPGYYVFIQCGNQTHKSKTSSGEGKNASWNEKFTFQFPLSCWKNLTYLKLRIMDKEMFTDGGFVGETIVHIGGILTEGNDKGFIELKPAPYNVVLEDDTYKGEIKIGLKFIANVEVQTETREYVGQHKEQPRSKYKTIFNFWKVPWWRFLFFYNKTNSTERQKKK